MAPSIEGIPAVQRLSHSIVPKTETLEDNKLGYTPGRTVVERHDNYPHEDFLPSFPDTHWGPIEELPYEDRGLHGDPKFRNLLANATDIFDYTPKIGTEVSGINLARINGAQRNDLARLVAERGVVFLRGQDEFDIEAQKELGRYLGPLHKVGGSVLFYKFVSSLLTIFSMLLLLFRVGEDWRMFMLCTLVITPSINGLCSLPASYGILM